MIHLEAGQLRPRNDEFDWTGNLERERRVPQPGSRDKGCLEVRESLQLGTRHRKRAPDRHRLEIIIDTSRKSSAKHFEVPGFGDGDGDVSEPPGKLGDNR